MEMILNLSLKECLLRGLIAVLLIFALALIQSQVILFALPVIIYLYVTAIVHRCPVKHWLRSFKKIPDDNDNAFWDEEENP